MQVFHRVYIIASTCLLASTFLLPSIEASGSFVYKGGAGCNDNNIYGLLVDSFNISCDGDGDGDEACEMDDVIGLKATFSIQTNFSSYFDITTSVCRASGYMCGAVSKVKAVDVCEYMSGGDGDCPGAGDFEIEQYLSLEDLLMGGKYQRYGGQYQYQYQYQQDQQDQQDQQYQQYQQYDDDDDEADDDFLDSAASFVLRFKLSPTRYATGTSLYCYVPFRFVSEEQDEDQNASSAAGSMGVVALLGLLGYGLKKKRSAGAAPDMDAASGEVVTDFVSATVA